jgi:uncharacterized iron-regulated membrane protein
MMRKIHRWVSFPLIVAVFLVTLTGVVLQGQEMGGAFETRPEPPKTSALPADAELVEQLQKALSAARAAKPDFAAQRLDLDFSRGGSKARFGVSPRGAPSVEVDMKSGETKVEMNPKPNLHVLMIQLHTGRYFGPIGLAIIMVVSIIFLILTVTGFMVYLDMWKRRKAAGKAGLFWS